MKARGLAIGAAVGAGVLNAVVWIAVNSQSPYDQESEGLLVQAFACLVGALFGGGVGLTVGAGLSGPRPRPLPLLIRDGNGNLLGRPARSPEKGLSALDLLTSSLYALTWTGIGGVFLTLVYGSRGLAELVMEVSPLGSLGPGWALISALGSIGAVGLVAALALASRRPPMRCIDGASRKLLAGAGFLSGLLWPGLLLSVWI